MNIQKLRKKIRRLRSDKKAVSPVISTIIIVAIAIAISIAVALYLTGITGTFTKFERLDVTSAYAGSIVAGNYPIEFTVKNSGTSAISIDRVLINGKPNSSLTVVWDIPGAAGPVSILLDGTGASTNIISMAQGDSGTITFNLGASIYKSGQSLELTFHTVSGKEYPKVVVLP